MRHRGQDVEEEPQTRRHVETPAIGMAIEVFAGNVLQHQVRRARRRAGIEEMRDSADG